MIGQPALSAEDRVLAPEELAKAHFAPLAEELDHDQRYPWENVAKLVDSRIAGLFMPAAYGGVGATLAATIAAVGMDCSSTAAIVCADQLKAFPVLPAGREDQKSFYLGAMAKGTGYEFGAL